MSTEDAKPSTETLSAEGPKAESPPPAPADKDAAPADKATAEPKKGSDMTPDEKAQAIEAAKKKAADKAAGGAGDKPDAAKKEKEKEKALKADPKVREGRPVAGGVVAPKGTTWNREEIIAKALEKIRATEAFEADKAKAAEVTRRDLFANTGWALFTGFVAFLGAAFGRFFFPRVLFEPPTKFKAGFTHEYAIGEVSSKYKDTNRVWIVRDANGFFAVFARCTHLGCTPIWLEGEQKFKCPCHGSGYTKEAINYEGPAPRPMDRCYITRADDGQILIDSNKRYIFQGPEGRNWESQGAFLRA